jgi:hypothetical protein
MAFGNAMNATAGPRLENLLPRAAEMTGFAITQICN